MLFETLCLGESILHILLHNHAQKATRLLHTVRKGTNGECYPFICLLTAEDHSEEQ